MVTVKNTEGKDLTLSFEGNDYFFPKDSILMIDDDVLPDVVVPREPLPLVDTGHHADVHPDNILPPGTRRRVHFEIKKFMSRL